MKILLTSKKRKWSGETAFIAKVARGFVAAGHEVVLGSREGTDLWNILVDTGVRREALQLIHSPWAMGALWRDMRRFRRLLGEADLVHTHASWDTWVVAATRARWGIDVPLVRSRHNLKDIENHPMNRWLYGRSITRLIACSRTVDADLARFPFVPAERRAIIKYGIDLTRFDPTTRDREEERRKLRERIGAPMDAPVVTYASRYAARKHPEILVDAAAKMLREGSPAWFVFAGGVPRRGKWFGELRDRMDVLAPRVQRVRFIEDMPGILMGSDLMVLPAPNEPFGLVTVEAMAMGCPPVCTADGGSAEIIEDGVTGSLFPAGDADALADRLRWLIADPEARQRMAVAGGEEVRRRYSDRRMIQEYLEEYHTLLGTVPSTAEGSGLRPSVST